MRWGESLSSRDLVGFGIRLDGVSPHPQRRTRQPLRIHNVAVVVQLPRKMPGIDFILRENRFMRVRMVPIRRHRLARAVGKMDLNRQPPRLHQRRFHMNGNRIQFRVTDRFHVHPLAVEFEMTGDFAVPQIQPLFDVRQIIRPRRRTIGVFQDEPDLAEVEAMRVVAQPCDFRRHSVFPARRHKARAAVQVGKRLEREFVNVPAIRVRDRVPAPIRQRAERRGFFKRRGKCLQPGRVHREGEPPVADRQRIGRVEICQHHIVPRDQRVPVNGRGMERRRQ